MYEEYARVRTEFYESTQKESSLGQWVTNMGYHILKGIDLRNKTILEYGSGLITHNSYWNHNPDRLILVDINEDFLSKSDANIKHLDIDIKKVLIDRDQGFRLPQKDDSLDMILAFYTLEHLYPLRDYLKEFHRILKPDGLLVGAIPSEGGIPWGLGRYLTTRRWFKKNSNLDPDKLICWEHPNFADDVMDELHKLFMVSKKQYYPLPLPSYDFNLTSSFVAHKIDTTHKMADK